MTDFNFQPSILLENNRIIDASTIKEIKKLNTDFYPTFIDEIRYMNNYGDLYNIKGNLLHKFTRNRLGFIPSESSIISRGEWKKKEYVIYAGKVEDEICIYSLTSPYSERVVKGYFHSVAGYFLIYYKTKNAAEISLFSFLDLRNNDIFIYQLLETLTDIEPIEVKFDVYPDCINEKEKFLCTMQYGNMNILFSLGIVNICSKDFHMIYQRKGFYCTDIIKDLRYPKEQQFIFIIHHLLYETYNKTLYRLIWKKERLTKEKYTDFFFSSIQSEEKYTNFNILYKGDKELILFEENILKFWNKELILVKEKKLIFWNYETEKITKTLNIRGSNFIIIGNRIKAYSPFIIIYDFQGKELFEFTMHDNFAVMYYRMREKQEQLIKEFQELCRGELSKNLINIVLRFM